MSHPLFDRYPIVHFDRLADGTQVPIPYHIYRGTIVLVGGTADLTTVRSALTAEQVRPVTTQGGRALMALWICDFHEASLGPHHELQFSLFVSRCSVPPLSDQTFSLLDFLNFNPHARMLCYRLWNDTDLVVRYNSELLGLNAQMMSATMRQEQDGRMQFACRDADGLIVDGQAQMVARQPLGDAFAMLHQMGLRKMMQLATQPWLSLQVMNSVHPGWPHNTEAQAYSQSDHLITRRFDPAHDGLVFHDPAYAALDFQPLFISQIHDCRFVYLHPHNRAAVG